jgi:hypothetical protein
MEKNIKQKNWEIFEKTFTYEGVLYRIIELIPKDDLMPHTGGDYCPCKPKVVDGVLIHNSFDMREEGEAKITPRG